MRNILAITTIVLSAAVIFTACTKVKDLPFYDNGTAVTLSASTNSVSPQPSDSLSEVISFTWSDPKYASDPATFKYILEIDSAGRNFSTKTTKTVTGELTTSLTGKELNAILLGYGFAIGSPVTLDFRVTSSYGNNNEQYLSNIVNVEVTPYGDSSVLQASQTSVTCALATAANNAVDFSWTPSFNGYAGDVTYTLQYDSAGKNFAGPKEIAVGVSVYTKSLTQGEINETAINSGVIGGTAGTVDYRIKASTALGAVVYSNLVSVTIQTYESILRFYMPGSYQTATGQGTDWTPADAPELIRDLRTGALNNIYYIYIYLPAGTQFKLTQGRSWDINYGGTGGVLARDGSNFSVAAAGVYRVTVDRNALTYDISQGRMGFVGGATGAGWNPPNVFPNYALGAPETNLFVGLTDFTVDGWKLIDANHWNNSTLAVDNARSYGSAGASGSTMVINDANFPNVAAAGRYRVMWDGRNRDNIKYEMSPANEMRMVGDGMVGVTAWDPPTSPQMTYLGSGKWQLVIDLIAGKDVKFLAGNAWGALDYEDNSGGSTATGTPRKIKWEGGDNFKTPAVSGTYTVILDENNQTVTFN